MLYYLFEYLEQFDFPGAGVFQYISFRASLAVITSLIISTIFGKKIIYLLQRKQIGEEVRNLGLEGQMAKKGTPTMGGIIIIGAIIIPTLLFGDLMNVYVQLMLVTTLWLGLIGFMDDYIKVFRKNKEGLAGKFKIIGQIGIGLIVGLTLYLNDGVIVREAKHVENLTEKPRQVEETDGLEIAGDVVTLDRKSTKTTIPFYKSKEFDYKSLVSFMGHHADTAGWIVFILAVIFIVTAVSNGANITDGLDGLATGTSSIIGLVLGVFAYVSGNLIYADYLNILYIPFSGELVIFVGAFVGATIGFLWYNSYPAQVFMGDTGSLSIGGIIAVLAIIIKKELLIPILCGIFLIENISVMIQVSYFKYTRKKFGEGKRVFLMAPLHHHYQKKGYPEAKIVARFWIVQVILAVFTLATLKIR